MWINRVNVEVETFIWVLEGVCVVLHSHTMEGLHSPGGVVAHCTAAVKQSLVPSGARWDFNIPEAGLGRQRIP